MSSASNPSCTLYLSLLLAAFIASLLPAVLLPDVGGSSEARELHVAQMILSQQEYVLPLRNGLIPSKPPLFHWVSSGIARITTGEVVPMVGRTTSMLAALLTLYFVVQLAGLIGNRIFSERSSLAQAVSIVSFAVLASSYGFFRLAVDARVDMLFVAFVTGCLWSVLSGLAKDDGPSERSFLVFYIFAGLAVLTKGPLGLALPLFCSVVALAAVLGLSEALKRFLTPSIGWILFLLIVSPWYLLATYEMGADFLNRQLVFENLDRLVGTSETNSKNWWFYLPSFLRQTFPWGIVFIVGIFKRTASLHDSGSKAVERFLIVWVLAGLLLFSVAAGKRNAYLVPLFPALAIFVAIRLVGWSRDLSTAIKARLAKLAAGMAKALVVFMLFFFAGMEVLRALPNLFPVVVNESISWVGNNMSVLLFFVLCGLTIWFIFSFHFREPLYSLTTASLISLGLVLGIGFGVKHNLKGFKRLALDLKQYSQQPVLLRSARDEFLDPLLYYYSDPVELVLLDQVREVKLTSNLVIVRREWYSRNRDKFQHYRLEQQFSPLADRASQRQDRIVYILRRTQEG